MHVLQSYKNIFIAHQNCECQQNLGRKKNIYITNHNFLLVVLNYHSAKKAFAHYGITASLRKIMLKPEQFAR